MTKEPSVFRHCQNCRNCLTSTETTKQFCHSDKIGFKHPEPIFYAIHFCKLERWEEKNDVPQRQP